MYLHLRQKTSGTYLNIATYWPKHAVTVYGTGKVDPRTEHEGPEGE